MIVIRRNRLQGWAIGGDMQNKFKKTQSFIEYCVLIAIIAISLGIMTRYVYRSLRAREAHLWQDLYHPIIGLR